ncbi:NitT/TauT family transport system ATP-binding protein/taurine transport system ATP-binding protein [Actinocorallia herbida]|uniref:NitT/TauT family transport system ATP-binding protein/taurine transport system ATP-binding protein n=1 Tax=Actinocorallia herbida TaxID=58109 RepID=A0A3N1CTB1_9ACTN|nr:ABC transporter ATP-binding protein [Actinocorallia herbida]ROO84414.1 NitT/TauT family transport system ATP-binding protein/taurine transport system ATP-binding protein [Actinocorallia herbida]
MPSPADAGGAVTLRGVSLVYGGRRDPVPALADIDADLAPGSFTAIVGPSGCGKSTLLRLVAGFAAPTGGEVAVSGSPVTGPGPDRGVVFQQPRLFPWLSVRGNVEFGLKGLPKAARRARSAELLELVGLADAAGRRPYELSGGMQQRAAIARALAPDPAILLMDEPFAALDALTRERLQEELRRVWQATGKTVLFVTHSVDEAVYLGTRVLVLSKRPGRVVLDAASELPYADDPHLHPDQPAFRDKIASAVRAAAA